VSERERDEDEEEEEYKKEKGGVSVCFLLKCSV
jgi:hypothetical protein